MTRKKMSDLILHDSDTTGDLIVSVRPPHERKNNVRIGTDHHNNFVDLHAQSVRSLRDWLDDWLGDTVGTSPPWTREDVERLVEVSQRLERLIGMPMNLRDDISDALAPFLSPPDPDAELVEKMMETAQYQRSTTGFSLTAATEIDKSNMRELLAVVRAHDKEHSDG